MGSKDVKNRSTRKETSTHSKNKSEQTRNPKKRKVSKVILVAILMFFIIVAGIFAGIFFGIFGDDFKITKEDLIIDNMNTVVKDNNGNVIAKLSGEENRTIIAKDKMPEYLPKAFRSIEDERFYKHHGVDLKRTLGATVQYVIHKGSSSYGGSTITQQLVKNLTKDKDDTGIAGMVRKVKEMSKAYQVEKLISKDQILELYLNIIFLGDQAYGVEVASKYYFNKSVTDLDLAECAFLAGINHSPNGYKPFDTDNTKMQDKIKKRTKTVLMKMKQLGAITNNDEYEKAVTEVDNGLAFNKGETTTNVTNYSYHTAAAINQVKKDLMEKNNWSDEYAELQVKSKGYIIYSTEDTNIQAKMEEEFAKENKYQISSKTSSGEKAKSQAAMVVIDHKTGQVLGTVGGLGTKVNASGLNRATQAYRQPGSTIKPIAVIAPGLTNNVLTAGTVYADVPTNFGTDKNPYEPKNDSKEFLGSMTIREAIERSQNIPEVKAMSDLGPGNSIKFLKSIGITRLISASDNKSHNDENVSLALGGVTNGISPLEMAAAYAMIANNGEYIKPTFYTKVEDKNGHVIIEATQEKKQVMTEQNAYVLKSILTAPVTGSNGTATYCKISGMDVGAKTGTTNDSKDRWLCGFTPYYTAATWYGYDESIEVNYKGRNPAGQIWSAVMSSIHKGLDNAKFDKPSGIVTKRICKDTGLLASSRCQDTYDEVFASGTEPKSTCKGGRKTVTICSESGKIATSYCPNPVSKTYKIKPEKEEKGKWKSDYSGFYGNPPTQKCTIHTSSSRTRTNSLNSINSKSNNNNTIKNDNSSQTPAKPENKATTDGGGTTNTVDAGSTEPPNEE